MEEETREEGQPAPTCAFWVEKRRRRCHQPPAPGHLHCPSHLPDVAGRPRIPCPIDPKHTCYASRLQQHLLKCPAARRRAQVEEAPYYRHNINMPDARTAAAASSASTSPSSPPDHAPEERAREGGEACRDKGQEEEEEEQHGEQGQQRPRKRRKKEQGPSVLVTMPADELQTLVATVRKAHAMHCREPLETVTLRHPACEPYFTPAKGGCNVKHMVQQSSILGHMAAAGMLVDGACFVEFGAGKGNLSDLVHACCPRASHVLVDRQTVRHKAERRFLRDEGTADLFTRLNMDIAHLKLDEVPQVKQASSLVCVAKHICGSASDLAIRCAANSLGGLGSRFVGMAVALCCHHRCTYDAYLNKPFLASVGVTEKEYGLICRMSSWAVCGFPSEEKDGSDGGLDRAEKMIVGNQCKELLDLGRLLWLRERGLEVQLVRYVAPDVSPENTLLLALAPSRPAASSSPHSSDTNEAT